MLVMIKSKGEYEVSLSKQSAARVATGWEAPGTYNTTDTKDSVRLLLALREWGNDRGV